MPIISLGSNAFQRLLRRPDNVKIHLFRVVNSAQRAVKDSRRNQIHLTSLCCVRNFIVLKDVGIMLLQCLP
jgi:hypothetical protein